MNPRDLVRRYPGMELSINYKVSPDFFADTEVRMHVRHNGRVYGGVVFERPNTSKEEQEYGEQCLLRDLIRVIDGGERRD